MKQEQEHPIKSAADVSETERSLLQLVGMLLIKLGGEATVTQADLQALSPYTMCERSEKPGEITYKLIVLSEQLNG